MTGWVEGRLATLRTVVHRTLFARGIAVPEVPLDAHDIAGVSDEEVTDALFACKDVPDFRARLGALRRWRTRVRLPSGGNRSTAGMRPPQFCGHLLTAHAFPVADRAMSLALRPGREAPILDSRSTARER